MKTALLSIFLFLFMIFPHELGHFIAAKKCGVQVNEFSFGMGPAIWKKQRGETLHSIRLFPIGGYCAMEGEDGSEDDEAEDGDGPKEYNPRAFNNKKPWQKIIILLAGAGMNVLCAFLVMTILMTYLGFTTMTIAEVAQNSPSYEAGIMAGDKVIRVDGEEVDLWTDFGERIQKSEGKELTITVLRDKEELDISLTPSYNEEEKRYVVGTICEVTHNPLKGIKAGFFSTGRLFVVMYDSLKLLLTGGASIEEVSGPVGIVQMVGETSSQGLWSYGFLVALICVNLAVINLLPLPALDGGRILIVLVSWITGKKISPKVEGIIHAVGIVLLLGLAIFVTINDVGKLFG